MSGGSYDYLCFKDFPEICEKPHDINDMRDRLTQLGYLDVAKETESVNLIIDSFRVRIEARLKRLGEVWKAIEWYDSNDWGIEEVEEAIKKYREEQ